MRQWIMLGISFIGTLSVVTSNPIRKRASAFDSLVVFGDSYSDNGSLDEFYSDPSLPVPNSVLNDTKDGLQKQFKNQNIQEYRRSNGPLLVEYLSSFLQTESLYDFARSGATANNSIVPRQTQDVDTQTRLYLKSNLTNKKRTLFLTWIGVNDIHDIFVDRILSDAEKQQNIRDVIQTLRVIMNRVYQNGGERHALLGLIPIEQLPLFNSLSQAQRGQLQGDIHMFNGQLRELVNEMNAQGKHAYFVDLHKAYLDLYGDVKQPSMDCSGQSDCKDLIWWDEWHPTTKVHKALAEKTVEALSLWE